jgi:predicted glycosyltransferase
VNASQSCIWIDIDNPPQVQYLAPVAEELERRGFRVVVTARDNSITHQLLKDRGTSFLPVGHTFGKQKWRKIIGVLGRALGLVSAVRGSRPSMLLCASRSGALAARILGIPGFVICDYEFAELKSYTKLGTFVAFPDSIPDESFRGQGFRDNRLIPFPGLKENLTFFGRDVVAEDTFRPPGYDPSHAVVAFRPPASETHYYSPKSKAVYEALLEYLAQRDDIHLVFLPRYDWQTDQLDHWDWKCPVHVPDQPIPPIPLLKGADLVISSGGTMLREAAFLGVPSYSIFQSAIGGVDKDLEDCGRMVLITGAGDFDKFLFQKKQSTKDPATAEDTMDFLLNRILTLAGLTPQEGER